MQVLKINKIVIYPLDTAQKFLYLFVFLILRRVINEEFIIEQSHVGHIYFLKKQPFQHFSDSF